MSEKLHYLGRVVAPTKEAAIDKAMAEFGIEAAQRFRLIAEPVEAPMTPKAKPIAISAFGPACSTTASPIREARPL